VERVSFVTHRGVRILQVDYSGMQEMPELLRLAERACRLLEKEEPGSVYTLVDLSDTPYSLRLVRSLGDLAVNNAPYVVARALVGLPAFVAPVVREVARFSGRPTEMFGERGPAMDWLAERAARAGAPEGER
jgi:hypothetical protein